MLVDQRSPLPPLGYHQTPTLLTRSPPSLDGSDVQFDIKVDDQVK